MYVQLQILSYEVEIGLLVFYLIPPAKIKTKPQPHTQTHQLAAAPPLQSTLLPG